LKELDCRGNKLISPNLSNCSRLEKIDCFSNQLTNLNISNLSQLKSVSCSNNLLTNLDASSCPYLTKLDCSNNSLTSITLSANPTNLKQLNLRDNNFHQDLFFLEKATNLEELNLGNYDEDKINQGICNRFTGSLEPFKNLTKLEYLNINNSEIVGSLNYLSGMEKLKYLDIDNTDLNEVDIDKLPKSLEGIEYSIRLRPNCKLTEIVFLLDKVKYGFCPKCQQPNTSKN